jgi:hypothetical protein
LDKKIADGLDALNNTIQSFTAKIDDLESNNKKSMSTLNFLLQHKIDNDVIIRGFPGKLESKIVCENFVKTFNLDQGRLNPKFYCVHLPCGVFSFCVWRLIYCGGAFGACVFGTR